MIIFPDKFPAIILACAFVVILAGVKLLLSTLKRYNNAFSKYYYQFGVLGVMIVLGAFAFLLPISPANDSFDMINSLNYLLKGEGFFGYYKPYYSFWANNKVVIILYLSACKIFSNVEFGVRIVNFLCVFGSVLAFSYSIGKIFGHIERLFALFCCAILFPFIILTSPYAYPIAIFLASLTFALGICKKKAVKPLFFICVGLLFLIRPTAAIFIFVYFAFDTLKYFIRREKKRAAIYIGIISMMLASIFIVQTAVGAVFYKTNLHPYPNLTNAASGWTLDIGTRLDLNSTEIDYNSTGVCTYTPYAPFEDDEIAAMQNQLWQYFAKGDPNDYEAVKLLNSEIKSAIYQRTVNTFRSDSKNILRYIAYKTINLLKPSNNKFYFYGLNYNNPTFVWEANKNLTEDSQTHINALIILFIAAFIYTIFFVARRRKLDDRAVFVVSSSVSCITTILFFVALTEVEQRCLLDAFIPAAFVVCSAIILIVDKLSKSNKHVRKVITAGLSATVIAFLVSIAVYTANDIACLKGAELKIISRDEKTFIELTLKEDPPNGQYNISYNGEEFPLLRQNIVETDNIDRIYFRTPTRSYEIYTDAPWR